MKPLRRLFLSFGLLLTIGILGAIYFLRPPSDWAGLKVGMTDAEVKEIIPEFDQPWGDVKADFHYARKGIFTWQLSVARKDDKVEWIEKDLWTNWPDRRRIWSIVSR